MSIRSMRVILRALQLEGIAERCSRRASQSIERAGRRSRISAEPPEEYR
jgi:hypothetical protein